MKMAIFSMFFACLLLAFNSISIGEERNLIKDSSFIMKMNTFLTNFTEVHLEPFEKRCPKEEYIRFAICHNQINNPQLVEKKNNINVIHQKYLDLSIEKYFGITDVDYKGIKDYQYEAPYFLISPIPFTSIGIAEVGKIIKISNDIYEVDFAVYPASLKKYNSTDISNILKKLNRDVSDIDYMKARVLEKKFGEKKHFILLNYKLEISMVY